MPRKHLLIQLNEGEKVVMELHRHWSHIALIVLWNAILLALPPLAYLLLVSSDYTFSLGSITLPLTVLGLSVYYLIVMLFLLTGYVDYILDVWLVTTERIVNIEQQGLFGRVSAEKKLYRIQDVTAEVKGLLPTLLNFGDVYVQTAGEQQRFIFKQVPRAREVAEKIIDLMEQAHQRHPAPPNELKQ